MRKRERVCVLDSPQMCVYSSGPGEGEDEGGAIGAGGVGKIRMTGHKKRKWPIIISRGFSNLEQSTGPALGGQDAFDPVEGREGGGGVRVVCGAVQCGAVLGWTGGPQETRREASSAVVGGVRRRRTAKGRTGGGGGGCFDALGFACAGCAGVSAGWFASGIRSWFWGSVG